MTTTQRRPGRQPDIETTQAMYADYSAGMTLREVSEKWGLGSSSIWARFNRAGLKTRENTRGKTVGMYFDYCSGMSSIQVAKKWGITPQSVTRRFREMGLPLRPHPGGTVQPRVSAATPFYEANDVRAAEAGRRKAAAAQAALPLTIDELHRKVLQMRIDWPTESLAELAARFDPPMTKDAFGSHLRRALQNAGVTA